MYIITGNRIYFIQKCNQILQSIQTLPIELYNFIIIFKDYFSTRKYDTIDLIGYVYYLEFIYIVYNYSLFCCLVGEVTKRLFCYCKLSTEEVQKRIIHKNRESISNYTLHKTHHPLQCTLKRFSHVLK